MAYDTIWKDMECVPEDRFIVVFHPFYGRKIRMLSSNGNWYDDNEILDDSEAEWDLWAELPPIPGPK